MTLARSLLVDHQVSSVYHCVSRCANRQFLLSAESRAAWIRRRLALLSSLFALDVLEFAILDSHVHLLLRIRPELAWCWTAEEVAERWLALRASGAHGRTGSPDLKPTDSAIANAVANEAKIDEWRRRLSDLGWFHKEWKEPAARMWNREDQRAGPFWQGRYSSKVALDDIALTAQSFYIMLNAVRAGTESGIGRSEKTSIGARLKQIFREIRAGEHKDALRAFERRVIHGSWEPVLPCRPGSVAELSDQEYSARVAKGRRRSEVRNAVRKESETLSRLAVDAPVEDLVVMMTCGERASVAANEMNPRFGCGRGGRPPESLVRIPRHHLRPRPSSQLPADATVTEERLHRALTNPFTAERISQGSTAVLPGMTLGVLIQLLDTEGRREHPGKRGRIRSSEPRALGRLQAIALNGEIDEPALSPRDCSVPQPEAPAAEPAPTTIESAVTLGTSLGSKVAAALAVLDAHRQLIHEILEQTNDATSEPMARPAENRNDSPEFAAPAASAVKRERVRWFGSANGNRERVDAEAARRGRARVVSERPLAAA